MHAFTQNQKTIQEAQAQRSGSPIVAFRGHSQDVRSILHLQRTIGNQAVQKLLQENTDLDGEIDAALAPPRDVLSSSKDGAARQIVSTASNGEPLPADARAAMETHFGFDFSHVRIHTGSRAVAGLSANAVTSGQHIWFRPGRGPWDRSLLAHEISHVVQQATGEDQGLDGARGDKSRREVLERQAEHQQRPKNVLSSSHQPLRAAPLPSVAPNVLQFDFEDDVLLELRRLPSADEEGLSEVERRGRTDVIAGRKARLSALFSQLSAKEAVRYHERLRVRRRGDALSERFHDMLATATRSELLGILERAPQRRGPEEGPSYSEVLRLDQTLPITGQPSAQPNYADRSFQQIGSAPLGDVYILSVRPEQAAGATGISIPKQQFHLDQDPLTGFVIVQNQVYRSQAVADAVLADLRRMTPDAQLVTYYLRDGYIFPTTLSETTLPILIPNLRRVRENDLAGIQATGQLAEDLLWWYVGARFPIPIGRGRLPSASPAGREASREAARGGVVAAKAAFDAARTAEELIAATKSITHAGQRMIEAARHLSAMRNFTAVQKAEVMLEVFKRIGFTVTYTKGAAWVDEGAHLLMISDDGRYAFRFIKSTAEIAYGKFNMEAMNFVWKIL